MKRFALLLLLLITFNQTNAQMQDLFSMAGGTLTFFNPIFEQDKSIYGYLAIYDLGNENENEKKFEYVILDTRLIKVANGEFMAPEYKKIESRFYSLEKIKDRLLISRLYLSYKKSYVAFTSHTEIDLKTNTPSKTFYLQEGEFIEGYRKADELLKRQKRYKNLDLLYGIDDDYLSFQMSKDKKSRGDINSIAIYGLDKNLKWEQSYVDEENKKSGRYLEHSIVYTDEETLVVLESDKYDKIFHVHNPETGEELFRYILETRESDYNYSYTIKRIEDELVLTGKISDYSSSGYSFESAKGLFKIVLGVDGTEKMRKFFLWEEASDYLEIKENGKLEKGYRLLAQDYFIFDDGRITFLAEKFKDNYNLLMGMNVPKATDFVLMQFDADFSLRNVETILKDKSKYYISDYLFSQGINDGKDVVFFYQDYQKESATNKRNWVLGIVKIIDGKINYERIPMSSEDFTIDPYIAKEGYILLREYNRKSNHNQIRLERLNL